MNTLKVGILLTALTALFVWLGQALGGTTGALIALLIAIAMNMGSYWFSDKLVLAMTRAKPLDRSQAPELFAMTERLAAKAGIPMPRLYLVPDPSPNAFATGRSPKNGVVAVNQGLLDMLNQEEVEGVVAHELAHIRHRDTLTMAIVASLAGAVMFIADMARFAAIFGGGSDDEGGPGLVGIIALTIVAPLAAILVQMGISRAREYEADRTAAKLVGRPDGLINALVKLERGNEMIPGHMPPSAAHMCIVNPLKAFGAIGTLLSTHPPLQKRVEALRALRV